LKRAGFIASFLAPAVLLYAALVVYPLIQALTFSTYQWRGVSAKRKFVGLENFQTLARDNDFIRSVTNNLGLLAGAGIVVVAVSLIVAHLTAGPGRSAKLLRGFSLVPQMVSLVAVAVLWQFIFNPEGLFNATLRGIGLGSWTRTWLGDPRFALGSVGVAFAWYAVGFYALLFGAGLRNIPAEVTEAAALDGSKGWHQFANITWPMLWSVKRTAITYLVINVMNTFALVFLMTRGGPDRASEVMLTYLYEQAFQNSKFGYATAVAVGNFAVAMLLSLGILFFLRKDPTSSRRSA